MEPEVSILIPTHNRGRLLSQALQSVLAQEVHVEVIVIRTSADVEAPLVSEIHDPRVRMFQCPNASHYGPLLNLGLQHVTAPWFCDLADDDMIYPGGLRALLSMATIKRADMVNSTRKEIDFRTKWDDISELSPPNGKMTGQYSWRKLLRPNSRCPLLGGCLYKSALIQQIQVDPSIRSCVDTLFAIMTFARSERAIDTDIEAFAYRRHEGQISNSLTSMEIWQNAHSVTQWAMLHVPEVSRYKRRLETLELSQKAAMYYDRNDPIGVGRSALEILIRTPEVLLFNWWWKMIGSSTKRVITDFPHLG